MVPVYQCLPKYTENATMGQAVKYISGLQRLLIVTAGSIGKELKAVKIAGKFTADLPHG